MKASKEKQNGSWFSFDKLLVFPFCILFIAANTVTILNYFKPVYYAVWKFSRTHGISGCFRFFEDLGMNLSMYCNDIISIMLIFMIITDMFFSIRSGKKQVVKWIIYGILTAVILFIGFVASPIFYDSV
ncbi:MAG: hypothetical protein IKH96_02285 [Ruminococcus sp.]|uniref:hypothetical protein n=1 Tax=Ruminococcus sp. TaxID=41978 RepID=UPI0025F4E91E|nr:hypothetical protein [Ruminococcus sp.]MBR6994827.1 hypothetical protein [Ruminococcus sp.]